MPIHVPAVCGVGVYCSFKVCSTTAPHTLHTVGAAHADSTRHRSAGSPQQITAWHRDRESAARRRGRIQYHLIEILVSCTTFDNIITLWLKHTRMHIAAALNVVSQKQSLLRQPIRSTSPAAGSVVRPPCPVPGRHYDYTFKYRRTLNPTPPERRGP